MFNKKHALDDDLKSPRNVITESNVDYLSYKFDEMDLAVSWRVLTKQKLNIANGIRLENASWRTWAKQRNNLKTVSPDTLNWLKDSDVTWLYGPLHTVIKEIGDTDRFAKPKISKTEDNFGLMTTGVTKEDKSNRPTVSPIQYSQKPLKSALKKVTMSDILKRSASELQINNNNNTTTVNNNNNGSNISLSEANQQLGAFSPAVIASHRQPKLRFNQYVEQCVALSSDNNNSKRNRMIDLNTDNDDNDDDDDTTSSDDNYEPDEESDTNSIIVMRRPKIKSSIKKIEPTLLKTNSRSDHDLSINDDSSDDEIIPTLSGYHKRKSTRNHNNTSHSNHNNNNNLDWDLESAESDALVNHIITVSKGKQPTRQKDPAIDRIPNTTTTTNELIVDIQSNDNSDNDNNSNYDYEFDDDDWDTHSEHIKDDTSFTTHVYHHQPEPIEPKVNKPLPPINNNDSLFTQIAHWASSHFWPGEK